MDEWQKYAQEIGLIDELQAFYDGWSSVKNCLTLNSEFLLANPKKTVNKIETFYNLRQSKYVYFEKEKYTRGFFRRHYMSFWRIVTSLKQKIHFY